MAKNKKLLAGFITLAILFMLLFSVFYITAEARHQCIGEDCPICLEVQACVQALNTLGTGIAPVVSVFAAACFFVICVTPVFHRNPSHTLVSLKVKLTN
ncbi:AraC family transcriptional regulator [Lacrimispora sp.]|uniref:AraC family transcriptional regulator n=1 Tax=Lacrimispora sp. TaxID=2719234 RepID=UPI00289A9A97|nr:AraC family transcriptional regulator [Lacrimispora sp.]